MCFTYFILFYFIFGFTYFRQLFKLSNAESITGNEDGNYTKKKYYAILTIKPVFKYLHL